MKYTNSALRRALAVFLAVLAITNQDAVGDAGETFYFALPGNSIGRERTIADEDHLRSVYHLVIERAAAPDGTESTDGAPTVTLEFLHGGEAHTYRYWRQDAGGSWVSDPFENREVDYEKPLAIELETLFDPDGPVRNGGADGDEYEAVLTSTNDFADGGVQEGVFRLKATGGNVRLLLYNVDGPYVDPGVDTFSPPPDDLRPEQDNWPHYGNGQWSPDVVRLFPINNLGEQYTLNIDIPDRAVVNGLPKASVTVIATRDNTLIGFESSPLMEEGLDGVPVPTPSAVRLNRGQMWTMSADQYRLALLEHEGLDGAPGEPSFDPIPAHYIDSALNLLNGMKISADKSVAVITAGGCAANRRSACDQTLTQLIPDRLQGNVYHIPLLQRGWADGFDVRIVALDEVQELKLSVKVSDASAFDTALPVDGQAGWNAGGGIQEFLLVGEPSIGEPVMSAGSCWEVVWASLPYLGNPRFTAERPGIDPLNRRLTLGYIIDAPIFEIDNESYWKSVLRAEHATMHPGQDGFPNATFMLHAGRDLPPAVMTITADAKISVIVSPKPWSANGPGGGRLIYPDIGLSTGKIRPSAVEGAPQGTDPQFPYVYYWDSYCGYALDNPINAGQFWGIDFDWAWTPVDGRYTEKVGIFTDPAVSQVIPQSLYSGFASVSVPMALSDEYFGAPRNYVDFLFNEFSGYNLPLSHYILLIVDAEFLDEQDAPGVKKLMYRSSFNTSGSSWLDPPLSDIDWVPLSTNFNNLVSWSNSGFRFGSTGTGSSTDSLTDPSSACREAFFELDDNGGINEWAWEQEQLPPLIAHDTGWVPLPAVSGGDEYWATVLRVVPFPPEDLQQALWGDRQTVIANPYVGDQQAGDLVPDIPIVTYEFAVGEEDAAGNFQVATGDRGIAAYSFGTGFFGTYLTLGSIPQEPLPDNELTISDLIAVAPGNTLIPSSVRFDGVQLVEGEAFTTFPYNDDESIHLSVDISALHTQSGEKVLSYELELRDVDPGTSRLVGESTRLEHFRYLPDDGTAEESIQERGPTSVSIADGPITLVAEARNSSGGASDTFVSPDADITAHASLTFDTSFDAYREVLSTEDELSMDRHVYENTRVIDDTVLGHDQLRPATVMLSRSTTSTASAFEANGTISLVFDAGHAVEWSSLTLREGIPQPQLSGGGVFDASSQVDLIADVRVRPAASVSQIESWRAGFGSAPSFTSVEIGDDGQGIDGVPPTENGEIVVLAERFAPSRCIEVQIDLVSVDFDSGGANSDDWVSPVLESVIAGYLPTSMVLDLDVTGPNDELLLDLAERSVEFEPGTTVFTDVFLSGDLLTDENYAVRARLIDEVVGESIAVASDDFEVIGPSDAGSILAGSVGTDLPSYGVGEVVEIHSEVENTSSTVWDSDLTVSLEVFAYDGVADLCTEDHGQISEATFQSYMLYTLQPGELDRRDFSLTVPNTLEPGTYRVIQKIDSEPSSGMSLLCHVADFDVRSSVGDGAGLSGSLAVDPIRIGTDTAQSVTHDYLVTNNGNVDLTDVEIAVVIEGPSGPVEAVVSQPLDLPPTQTTAQMGSFEPSETGTHWIRLYGRSAELAAGSSDTDYTEWVELAVRVVIVEDTSSPEDLPYFVAVPLSPLPTDVSTGIGPEDLNGGLNARGSVVGSSLTSQSEHTAVAWYRCATPTDLQSELASHLSGVGVETHATDVSDDETIVGTFEDATDGRTRSFVTGEIVQTAELLGPSGSTQDVVAAAVNYQGLYSSVVGWMYDDQTGESSALIWRDLSLPAATVSLSPAEAVSSRLVAVNDDGVAVGWYESPGGSFGMMWVGPDDVSHLVDAPAVLGPGVSSDIRLYGISNVEGGDGSSPFRRVVGAYVDSATQEEVPFQALLDISSASGQDGIDGIAVLSLPPAAISARALSIAKGQAVVGTMQTAQGARAFYRDHFGAASGTDLNDLILNLDLSTNDGPIHRAVDIERSASDKILGDGLFDGVERAVRLDRWPLSYALLDKLHLWLRADTGVADSGGSIIWEDITRGRLDSDLDFANTLNGVGGQLVSEDCCTSPLVRFAAGEAGPIAGLVNAAGAPLDQEGTLAFVFAAEADQDGSIVATLGGTADFISFGYSADGLLTVASDEGDNDFFLGTYPAEVLNLLVLRQDANDLRVWLNGRERVILHDISQGVWDEIEFGSINNMGAGSVSIAEAMVYESALTNVEVLALRDELLARHAIGASIVNEDTMLWLQSGEGVERGFGAPHQDRVSAWQTVAGGWGNLSQDDPNAAPLFLPTRYGPCIPSIHFDGNRIIEGVGPTDVLVVLDRSGSMDTTDMAQIPLADRSCDEPNHGSTDPNYPYDMIWGARFLHAREAVKEFIAEFASSDNVLGHRMGLMQFHTAPQGPLILNTDGVGAFTDIRGNLDDAVCAWTSGSSDTSWPPYWRAWPYGGTDFTEAFTDTIEPVLVGGYTSSPRRRAAIFLSDGRPDAGEDDLFDATDPGSIVDELNSMRSAGVPVHTIGLQLDEDSDPDTLDEAERIMARIAEETGGLSLDASSGDTLRDAYLSLVDDLSAYVTAATISLTFDAEHIPLSGEAARVILQAGDLSASGLNVWLSEDQVHIGVWWETPQGQLEFDSMSAPLTENGGLSQLVIRISDDTLTLRLQAYLNGVPVTRMTTEGTEGAPAPHAGDQGLGIQDAIRIESRVLVLGNMSLGGSATDELRAGPGALSAADGFLGGVVELLVYDDDLTGESLERLFAWSSAKYGTGALDRGYGPVAIAAGGGVGLDGLFDNDFDGVERVYLDATATYDADDPSESLTYQWYLGSEIVATGISPVIELPRGRHRIVLRVTDRAGHVSEDDLLVDINRVHQHIKPVDLALDHGPLEAVGDPLPATLPLSSETDSTLAVSGAVPTYQTGRQATSVELGGTSLFDISDGRQELPSGSAPRTFAIWFETGVTAHDHPSLFVQADGEGEGRFSVTGNQRRVAYTVDDYTRGVEWTSPAEQLPVGWHHLAVVVPRGALWADQVRLYLNGEELTTVPLDGSGPPGPLFTGDQQAYIGGNPFEIHQGTAYQGGRIDEVAMFSGALTPAEIADLFNDVPIAAWGFEQQSAFYTYASTAIVPTDLSTLMLTEDFAMINESGRLSLGKKGGATTAGAVFDAPTGNWTLMFKIQPESMTDDLDPLVSDSTGALLMLHQDSAGVPLLYIATTGSSLPAPTLFDGQEHWITLVSRKGYPGIDDGTFLFVDSVIDFAAPVSPEPTMLDGGPITIAGPNGNDSGFEGTIDNFHIFGRPLTQSECLQIVGE